MKNGIEQIAEERERQKNVERFDVIHDDGYANQELIGAAICYAANAMNKERGFTFMDARIISYKESVSKKGDVYLVPSGFKDPFPWSSEWDKRDKHDVHRSLVIAGALIAAELDRLSSLINPSKS